MTLLSERAQQISGKSDILAIWEAKRRGADSS
jgi:hypothetical protein